MNNHGISGSESGLIFKFELSPGDENRWSIQ